MTLCKQVTGWKARPATAGDVLSELQSPSWRAPLPQGTPPPACLPTGALGQEPQVVLRMGPTPPQGPPPGTLPVGASAWAGRQSCSWPGGHAGWPWRASLGPVLSAPRIEGRTDTRRAACLSGTAAGLAGHLPWELGGGGEGPSSLGRPPRLNGNALCWQLFWKSPVGSHPARRPGMVPDQAYPIVQALLALGKSLIAGREWALGHLQRVLRGPCSRAHTWFRNSQ